MHNQDNSESDYQHLWNMIFGLLMLGIFTYISTFMFVTEITTR